MTICSIAGLVEDSGVIAMIFFPTNCRLTLGPDHIPVETLVRRGTRRITILPRKKRMEEWTTRREERLHRKERRSKADENVEMERDGKVRGET